MVVKLRVWLEGFGEGATYRLDGERLGRGGSMVAVLFRAAKRQGVGGIVISIIWRAQR